MTYSASSLSSRRNGFNFCFKLNKPHLVFNSHDPTKLSFWRLTFLESGKSFWITQWFEGSKFYWIAGKYCWCLYSLVFEGRDWINLSLEICQSSSSWFLKSNTFLASWCLSVLTSCTFDLWILRNWPSC